MASRPRQKVDSQPLETFMAMEDKKQPKTQPVIPVLVILVGTTILLGNLDFLKPDVVGIAWPIFVITGGFIKLCEPSS